MVEGDRAARDEQRLAIRPASIVDERRLLNTERAVLVVDRAAVCAEIAPEGGARERGGADVVEGPPCFARLLSKTVSTALKLATLLTAPPLASVERLATKVTDSVVRLPSLSTAPPKSASGRRRSRRE